MNRVVSQALPWLAAYLATAVLVTGLYLLLGAALYPAVVGGVVGGAIGLFATLAFELIRTIQIRRRAELEVEELAAAVNEGWRDGLRVLHEDIRRDEERYPLRRVAPLEDEPPERS